MRAPPWWDAARTPIAFLVAPVAVPILAVVFLQPPLHDIGVAFIIVVSWFVAYVGVFVFGLPVYRFMLARNATTFWIAPAVGFVVGAIMYWVTLALVGLMFGAKDLGRPDDISDALKLGGVAGAAVGAVLWVIARPDLRADADEDRDQPT
jgi:Zn-dependent protease with chaperone function